MSECWVKGTDEQIVDRTWVEVGTNESDWLVDDERE